MFMLTKQAAITIGMALGVALSASWPVRALADPAQANTATQSHAIPLQSGDLVRLRSGGPLMIVESVHGDQVTCYWGKEDGEPQSDSFPIAMLTKPFTLPPNAPNLLKDERESDQYYRTHCPRGFMSPDGKFQCAY
jgi:uncharacterized protein YodC (DUF2158 family)